MSQIWIISDTHFNQANILNFTDNEGKNVRIFDSVTEMNQLMIDNWNSVVKPGDIIYHLGDVYFGSSEVADKILSRLMGKKRLLLGNHDNGKDAVLQKHFAKINLWRLFKEHNVLLTHVPIHLDVFRKAEYNVHGHIHQNKSPSKFHINLCVEKTDYKPVPIEEVLKYVEY